jgi:hypothetical protein
MMADFFEMEVVGTVVVMVAVDTVLPVIIFEQLALLSLTTPDVEMCIGAVK